MIHPTALVDASVVVFDDTHVGPFCIVEEGVILGHNVTLDAHVVLKSGVVLNDNVHVHAGAVLGDVPQIVNQTFDFESGVVVGKDTIIREGVTIHRASSKGRSTQVGKRCLLMAFSHVGHDTCIGNDSILANQVLLAGCVTIESHVFLSGGSMVHQHVHVGESAFVSGNSEVTMHIPPFVTVLDRNNVSNLNVVGLHRRQFSSEEVSDIKALYRHIYGNQNLSFKKKAEQLLNDKQYKTGKGEQFISFFVQEMPSRGFVYPKNA